MFDENLKVVVPNAAQLAETDHEAFAKIRRVGFGASDSSIILGVNKWTNIDTLIAQKLSDELTPDEIEVGNKPQVRMGADLEPIILRKFCEWSGLTVHKPEAMYSILEYPQLLVNFDGIIDDTNIPVECKLVSMFADRYWNKDKALKDGELIRQKPPTYGSATTVDDHINTMADMYGIPVYYYTQVQQQLLAVRGGYAYLAALFIKDWTLRVYQIYSDDITQDILVLKSDQYWRTIQDKKLEAGR